MANNNWTIPLIILGIIIIFLIGPKLGLFTITESGLRTYCTQQEFIDEIKNYQGTNDALLNDFRNSCTNKINPIDGCPTFFGGAVATNGELFMSCRSVCPNMPITGGKIRKSNPARWRNYKIQMEYKRR